MINVVNTALRSSMYRHKEQSYLHSGDRNRDRGAVCRVGGGGGGEQAGLKNLLIRTAARKFFLAFLGGLGACSPRKF